jgi:hypothetical protein
MTRGDAQWFRAKAYCWFSPERDKRGNRLIPGCDSFGAWLADHCAPIDYAKLKRAKVWPFK